VSDAAGHLAQRLQPFLLHDRLLGLTKVVIGRLEGAVQLGLVSREGDVFAQLAEELAFAADEGLGLEPGHDQHAEDLAFDL
jgi:hypothetical protein